MTTIEPPRRQQNPGGRPLAHRVLRGAIAVLAIALAFLLGMAFARTLDDRPKSGGAVTNVRTLTPLPQDAPVRTVTVTVTTP